MSAIQKVILPNLPAPVGHYSPAIVFNGLIFVSGQVPHDPITGINHIATIEEQTEQCLRNIERILQESNSGLDRVIKTTAFVSDMALWGAVNETYKRIFGEHRPARAIIPVGSFSDGMLIEIEAIAAVYE